MMTRTIDQHQVGRLARFAPGIFVLTLVAVVLLGLMAAVAQAGTMEASWRLTIGTAAVAKSDKVHLGDIASPVGDLPDAHWQRLSSAVLWDAPSSAGGQQVVSRRKLQKLLRFYLGDMEQLCVITGPLTVQRGGGVIRGPQLERLVVDSLTPQVSSLRGEVTLRDYRLPRQVFLSDETNNVKVEVAGEFKPGRISLLIHEINAANQSVRRYTGTLFLDQWVNVPCALRPINPHKSIGPEDVAFQRKNVAFLHGQVWDGRQFGMRVLRPVGGGEVIYQDNLEDVPLISRGDLVNLIFNGRYVHLNVEAKALADGRMGEKIPVQNLNSKREVVAQVVDGHTVVVR